MAADTRYSGTLVRLLLDELEPGPDATSELDQLLLMLVDRIGLDRFETPDVGA